MKERICDNCGSVMKPGEYVCPTCGNLPKDGAKAVARMIQEDVANGLLTDDVINGDGSKKGFNVVAVVVFVFVLAIICYVSFFIYQMSTMFSDLSTNNVVEQNNNYYTFDSTLPYIFIDVNEFDIYSEMNISSSKIGKADSDDKFNYSLIHEQSDSTCIWYKINYVGRDGFICDDKTDGLQITVVDHSQDVPKVLNKNNE